MPHVTDLQQWLWHLIDSFPRHALHAIREFDTTVSQHQVYLRFCTAFEGGALQQWLTTASRRSFLRPRMATLQPFLSNARAVAFPIPADPPADAAK